MMEERYWILNQERGGKERPVLLLVEQYGVVSTEQITGECGFSSTAESEGTLEAVEATGLITGINETTLRIKMLMMDWPRDRGMIGTTCMDEDGEYLHPPEQRVEELSEYGDWERDLREAGEWVYRMILDAATDGWVGGPHDSYLGGRAMEERTRAWVEWRRSVHGGNWTWN